MPTTRQRGRQLRDTSTSAIVTTAHPPPIPTGNATEGSDSSRRPTRSPSPNSLESARPTTSHTTPATGDVVRRMRWNTQLNTSVMRAYYRATEGGTNRTAYRARLLTEFKALEPNINVSTQRLADQVRVIISRKFLDDNTLDLLRREWLPSTTTTNVTDTLGSQQQNNISNNITNNMVSNIACDVDESIPITNEYMERIMEETTCEYRLIPHETRPSIPKLPVNKQNLSIVITINEIIKKYIANSTCLTDTHYILYCAAITSCKVANIPIRYTSNTQVRRHSRTPQWQLRIQKRIDETRAVIGKLSAFINGNNRPRIRKTVIKSFEGTPINIFQNDIIIKVSEHIDLLKQRISAWAQRIRRYKQRNERYSTNRFFHNNESSFYRNWECGSRDQLSEVRPDTPSCIQFWSSVWSDPKEHNIDADWICEVRRACANIQKMDPIIITEHDVSSTLIKMNNWRSPGPDGLHNFWLKWFTACHARLASQIQSSIENRTLPAFLTMGITHLIHKSGPTLNPKNYRPITCLPTIYKLITAILSRKILSHVQNNHIINIAQNGCRNNARGTKELLLIDMVICRQVKRNRKNLSAAWIDYKKAYDSVPHSWLKEVLRLYKIDTTIYSFLESCMEQWSTRLRLPGERLSDAEDRIRIRRGIFQGDSLSPLWFCLALNPLSTILEGSGLGIQLRRRGTRISHLLYMDDLKLFAQNNSSLMQLLNLTKKFSSDIRMEFGIDKCASIHVARGKMIESEGIYLPDSTTIRTLSEVDTYKYLGMSESLCINDTDMKQDVLARFYYRLKIVLKSLLSGGNKIKAYNTWVMPVLLYTFGILKWTQTELDTLDRRVRTKMTTYRMHHPRSSVMRLYIPRKSGGRGLLNAKNMHNREICNLREYFKQVDEDVHRDVVISDKGLTPLSLSTENWRTPTVLSTEDRKNVWKGKELHGRFFRALMGEDVDLNTSVHWLRFGDLFGETEGFVCAIQDEVVKTNNYRKYILKDGTTDICRACHRPGESLRHVISGCSQLANSEYLHRHNQVAKIVHQQLAVKYKLVESEVPYYKYTPQPVLENDHVKMYWDRPIITDRSIMANKPDIVILDRTTRKAILVDICVPHDDNLVKAEKDKMIKYIDLAHEITAMWDVDETSIVPIVVSANGLIAKSLQQHLRRLSLDKWIGAKIQKAVLLDTARIVRRFLSLGPYHR